MAEPPKRTIRRSSGLLGNYRYLFKKAMLIRARENGMARKKRLQVRLHGKTIKEGTADGSPEYSGKPPKGNDGADSDQKGQTLSSSSKTLVMKNGNPGAKDHNMTAPRDRWEVDSGFSEASPPTSGRSSPCPSVCRTSVVALDCEMVGTGTGGRVSELGRCSILDYHGNVLYDKYVRPCQPVTNFRTRWSGIRRHHMRNATPFSEAREEILKILEDKVIVGHSIYNDFKVLDIFHPAHMVRDTSMTRHLSRLAGFPRGRCSSLRILSRKLLKRNIQVGKKGHCSVEDATAALDLYKLVEGEWEQELERQLRDEGVPHEPSFASSNHYMKDEYWPEGVTAHRH
ncbi:apoptosis-enhancing nuclease [Oryzias latipes]|uniref:apoptosis-enhancing nuclease n=1 Tax=Oryzias latipes TaxID=8090 RepID=UPI0002A49CF8|nr:apoptosis-enhancing nuclease [Oryzias latipes]